LFPLSPAQLGIWLAEQLSIGTTAYLNPTALRLRGPLQATALREALRDVQCRHAPLRSRYIIDDDGMPVAHVLPPSAAPLPWALQDLSAASHPEKAANDLARGLTQSPFALDRDTPWRILLARLAKEDHLLVIVLHHLVSDGWSLGILLDELRSRYAARLSGGASPPPPPPSPDFFALSADAHAARRSPSYQTALEGWIHDLSYAPQCLPLPGVEPSSPGTKRDRAEACVAQNLYLPATATDRLAVTCAQEGVTLFAGLLTGLLALLCCYVDQRDLVVASPAAGRTHPGAPPLIGCFVNTVLLRCDLHGDPTVAEVTRRCHDTVRKALLRDHVALADIVAGLPRSGVAGQPTNVMLVQNNAPLTPGDFAGLQAQQHRLPLESVQRDWTVTIARTWNGLLGELKHGTRFDPRTMATAGRRLEAAWELIATAPHSKLEQAVCNLKSLH
jgi:iturin family lipopeptide synthetase A